MGKITSRDNINNVIACGEIVYSEKLTGVTSPVLVWPRKCASVEQVSSRPPHAAWLPVHTMEAIEKETKLQ